MVVPRFLGRRLLGLSAALCLAGCANLHLYSADRGERGKTAQKDWADASATSLDAVKVQRENAAALLTKEKSLVESAQIVSRDLRLYGIVTGSLKSNLVDPVRTRGEALQGPMGPQDFLTRLTAARAKEAAFQDDLKQAQLELQRAEFEPFSCEDLASGKAEQALADWVNSGTASNSSLTITAGAGLKVAKAVCVTRPNDPTAVRDLVAGELLAFDAKTKALNPPPAVASQPPKLLAELKALQAAEADLGKRSGSAVDRNAYRAALKEYQQALEAPDRDSLAAAAPAAGAASAAQPAASAASAADAEKPKPRTKLDVALAKLQAAIAKLKTYDDKFSLKLLAEERYAAIGDTLSALLDPKAADDPKATDKDRAGRALQRLSATYENWQAVQASAQEVRARPLLMQQSIDSLQAETLSRVIAMDAAKLQLRRDKVALLERQARAYRDAQALLGQGVTSPDASLTDALKSKTVSESEQTRLVQAAGRYGYAVGDLESQLQAKTLEDTALTREYSLALSANSVQQWNVLIGGNVDLLSTWAQSGLKEDVVAQYVNTLLLFALLLKAY